MTFPERWDGTSNSRPDPSVFRSPNGDDWAELVENHAIFPVEPSANSDVVGVATTINGLMMYHLLLTDVVVQMTDAGAAGSHGSCKLFNWSVDVPQCILGPKTTFDLVAAGGVDADADFVLAIGSQPVAVDNATLTSTEADLIGSQAGTFIAGVDALSPSSLTIKSIGVSDGAYLNLAVPDVDSSADGTITINGRVSFIWTPWYTL